MVRASTEGRLPPVAGVAMLGRGQVVMELGSRGLRVSLRPVLLARRIPREVVTDKIGVDVAEAGTKTSSSTIGLTCAA